MRALKEIQEKHADNPDSRSRFVAEAEITGQLEHPGIVPVYGLGHYGDGRPFYAMRFIRGDSLQEVIQRFHQAEGPKRDPGERSVELRQLLGRFVDVCNALAYAHSRGVLHRDLKPGNIMLGPYGETLVVDWGLAKPLVGAKAEAGSPEGPVKPSAASGYALTQAGQAVGTPPYMSPEQAAGRLDQLGFASDVSSLGATLYCLLTGRAPFEERELGKLLQQVQRGEFPPPRQINRHVPAALEAICTTAMALRPADRYASPRALAKDVERWLADEPVSAYREPWTVRLARWRRRHKTLVTVAAVLLLAVVGGGTLGTGVLGREQARIQAHALVLLPGPVEFWMGSPGDEPGRTAFNEPLHRKRIPRSFAIAATEVTVEQFLRFRHDHRYVKKSIPKSDRPMIKVTWYQAAEYCNWLSKEEGIPRTSGAIRSRSVRT